MKESFDEITDYISQHHAFQEAMVEAENSLATAQTELDATRRRAGDKAATKGVAVDPDLLDKKHAADVEYEVVLARRRQLKEHVDGLPKILQRFEQLRAATITEATEQLNAVVTPILEQYRSAMRIVAATSDALGIKVSTSDPDASIGALLRVPALGDWKTDSRAVEIHDKYVVITQLGQKLAGLRQAASRRAA